MELESRKYGYEPEYIERENPLTCSGIGTGSQTARYDVKHQISLDGSRVDSYTSPELPQARTPALLGLNSMKRMRALIDTFTGKIFFVGNGGYKLLLSPGSEQYELERSQNGHLMLPCSKFRRGTGPSKHSQSFAVGPDFEADPTSGPEGHAVGKSAL